MYYDQESFTPELKFELITTNKQQIYHINITKGKSYIITLTNIEN